MAKRNKVSKLARKLQKKFKKKSYWHTKRYKNNVKVTFYAKPEKKVSTKQRL